MIEQERSHNILVVIPVFNGERTISGTIEALLKQTLAPAEIIIVDDGSTDNTVEVVRKFGSNVTLISKSLFGKE